MAYVVFMELVDLVFMVAVLGFIFMDIFKHPDPTVDPLAPAKFNWQNFFFACLVAAPAVIFHELGHKLVGLAFGMEAIFHAAYLWLLIGVVLKLMKSPFIFFVPGYVAISGAATPLSYTLVALAGPAVNLLLYVIALIVLRLKKGMNHTHTLFWILTKKVNLFLFFFNLIPIGFFDGAKVLKGIMMVLGM